MKNALMATDARSRAISTPVVVAAVVIVAVGVLAGALLLGGGGPREPDPDAAQEQVQTLGQKLSLAIQHKRDVRPLLKPAAKLVEAHPDFAPAHTLEAQVLMAAGELKPAAAKLRRSLELGGEDAQVRSLLGAIHMKLGDRDAARSNYQAAISLDKDDPEHHVKLANLEYEAGDLEAAKRAALDALQANSAAHQAHMLLSQVYEQRGEPDLAQQQMVKALEVLGGEEEDTRVAYVRRRAAMLRRANRPEDALAALRELPAEFLYTMDIAPDVERTYGMMGQPMLAAAYYETLSSLEPMNPAPAAAAARWHLRADDPDAARAMLERVQRLDPRHPQLNELRRELDP